MNMRGALVAILPAVVLGSAGVSLGETVTVGFEGSAVAGRLSAEDRGRIEGGRLQDLMEIIEGRYTFDKDDGICGTWGLEAIAGRVKIGPKPYEKLRKGEGKLQSERVVFADPGTGAQMMMLSMIPYQKDSAADELNYYGKACWSADGALLVYQRSKVPGLWGPGAAVVTEDFGPMVVEADGSGQRILQGELAGKTMRSPICSPLRAEVGYTVIGTELSVVNLKTGAVEKKLGDVPRYWWLKVSPDDRYVMGKSLEGFWVIATGDGKRWDVKIEQDPKRPERSYAVHDSYRFVPGNTDCIMYWYETNHPGGGLGKEGFRIRNFKTGEETVCPVGFDWNHGDVGRHLGFHTGGYITEWDGKTFKEKEGLVWPEKKFRDWVGFYSEPVRFGGYAVHWPDDQRWGYALTYVQAETGPSPYLSEISAMFARPLAEGGRVNRMKVCSTGNQGTKDKWGGSSICLSRPNMSPDGTKMLWNSNAFTREGAFVVMCKLPEAPTGVDVEVLRAGGVKVSWREPKYKREIAGYEVWRSSQSGEGFELISPLVKGTGFADDLVVRMGTGFYAVRSVEWSGLRSGLSEEVMMGRPELVAAMPVRIFCEAEKGVSAEMGAESPDAMWVGFDGLASDTRFIWQRRKDKGGSVKVEVNVPRDGEYFVVARMKGKEGAAFKVGGKEVAGEAGGWKWGRSAEAVSLKAGKQVVEIASEKYGSCLDCFYLATDKGFEPKGRMVVDAPGAVELKAEATAEGHVKLSWSGAKSPRWSHYNIYCSEKAGFEAGRKTLVASPDEDQWLDWQAAPGKHYYRVTQVTVDGVESKASDEVEVETKR